MAWAGERGRFERLVDAHLPDALRFAVRLTGSIDEAEELVQDSMLRASAAWRTFRGESEFRTWLFRIVINTNWDRIEKSRTRTAKEFSLNALTSDGRSGDVSDERQVPPGDTLLAMELGERIAHHVSRLPQRQCDVLVLSTYEGLTPGEIARLLKTTVANVHSTLHVARSTLRRQLESYLLGR